MNLFANLPAVLEEEDVLPLLLSGDVRIERIVSHGQSSAPEFWYDQEEHEWVLVLKGFGVIEYPDGTRLRLAPGDHLHIPPHQRHRVHQTSSDEATLWLAVFWREA